MVISDYCKVIPDLMNNITGWWFQALWKIWKSMGRMTYTFIMKNKKCLKPPTRRTLFTQLIWSIAHRGTFPCQVGVPKGKQHWIHIMYHNNVWIGDMEQRYGTDPSNRYGTGVWNGGMEWVWSRTLFRTLYFDLHPYIYIYIFIMLSYWKTIQ